MSETEKPNMIGLDGWQAHPGSDGNRRPPNDDLINRVWVPGVRGGYQPPTSEAGPPPTGGGGGKEPEVKK